MNFFQTVDNAIMNWFTKPAKWWQFWYPNSGPIGAVIMCLAAPAVLGVIIFLIAKIIG